ncbi:MAG: hypothetical protein LC750_07810 [Actinobacteria bacterium]|nr:hypothetical protein [Actinomycetota bacterium]
MSVPNLSGPRMPSMTMPQPGDLRHPGTVGSGDQVPPTMRRIHGGANL